MHPACKEFWRLVKKTYNEYTTGKILEVGSYDINGSIKDIFVGDAKSYTGVDWRSGPNVDIVSLAHNMEFDESFKAVFSASMLEHDPYWRESITKMASLLEEDGILVLTWGAALNKPHCLAEAPDGKFHSLKVGLVYELLEELGFHITLFIYDSNLGDYLGKKLLRGTSGEVNLVAFKQKKPVIHIDDLLEEDKV